MRKCDNNYSGGVFLQKASLWDGSCYGPCISLSHSVFHCTFENRVSLFCVGNLFRAADVTSVNTHFRCFVIFQLPHFYRSVCHSLSCRRVERRMNRRERKKTSIGHTFIHFSFLVLRFFSLYHLFSAWWFLIPIRAYHKKRTTTNNSKAKKTRPSEKCEPINCVFSLFCILYFFLLLLLACLTAVPLFMLFSFCVRSQEILHWGCVPLFQCVSKMLFILGNMLVRWRCIACRSVCTMFRSMLCF